MWIKMSTFCVHAWRKGEKSFFLPTRETLQKKTRQVSGLNLVFFSEHPWTYPRRSYLESLHSDAHCVPYFRPCGGHQEFRTLWSSWKKKKTKRQRSLYWAWRANPVGYLFFSQRERDKYNFLSIKVTGREARDLQVLSSRGLCWIYSPLERKGTKLGRCSLLEENESAPGGVWRQWDKGHSES